MNDEASEVSQPNCQPEGIFAVDAKFRISGISISIPKDEEPKIHADFHIGLDMTDKWLSIAELNVEKAVEASKLLDLEWRSGNNEAAVPHLKSEFYYSIQSVCASAFAIDAFYASVKEHINIPQGIRDIWNRNRTSRPARIAEVIKLGFTLDETTFKKLKKLIEDIFSLRDKAVHPSAEMSQPLYHPRLKIGMSWHFVWFREENARNCYGAALSIICPLFFKPRPKNKALGKYCKNAIILINPLLINWELKYGTLFERHPL